MAKYFPEILAMLIYWPVGMFMGHMIHFPYINSFTLHIYGEIEYFPFIVGAVAALLTGMVHQAIKLKCHQYKYEHMYFQMVGLILLLVTAGLLIAEEFRTVAYVGFIAHGIIYVSALSYINIRTGQSKYRYFMLSIPHFFYLGGVSLGVTINWLDNKFIFEEFILEQYRFNGVVSGVCLMAITIFLICLFLVNESLQLFSKSYNYKESLDDDINRENTNKEIFQNKYFHIKPLLINYPGGQLPHIALAAETSGMKEFGRIVYTLSTKVLSMMMFYYPFVYIGIISSVLSLDDNIFLANWFATVGIVISLIFMALTTMKINQSISITIKNASLIILLVFFSFNYPDMYEIKIITWCVFLAVGFGFSLPDINILSYTNLKANEAILGMGYGIEHVIIGVMQYETLVHPENIFDMSSDFNLIFTHAITFIIILTCVGILGSIVIPKGDTHSSLLQIKNILNNAATFNYIQQNTQLIYHQQNYPQMAPQYPPMSYNQNNNAYPYPYAQNIPQYGQPNYPQQQQQQFHQPLPQQHYQQSPYNNQMGNAPGQYPQPIIPPIAVIPQVQARNQPARNDVNTPWIDNSKASPAHPNEINTRPVFPPDNPKYAVHS